MPLANSWIGYFRNTDSELAIGLLLKLVKRWLALWKVPLIRQRRYFTAYSTVT